MPVKIRLQRHGKKGRPYFHIVVADARATRDGRYIERLGFYNPNTNPATIEIDVDSASQWLVKGAQPTDTAKAILSYKGVLYKNHLQRGVLKGALTQELADERFAKWLEDKNEKIDNKKKGLVQSASDVAKARMKAEEDVNKAREAAIAIANAPVVEEVVVEEAPADEAPAAEAEQAPAVEEPATKEAPAAKETPAAEETPVAEEAPAAKETPAAEETSVAEETPVVEKPKATEEKMQAADAKAEDGPSATVDADDVVAEIKEEAAAEEAPAADAPASDEAADDTSKS